MLENAILYRIDAAWLADIEVASKGFERLLYEPIGPTQDQAIGWTQPRGEEVPESWFKQYATAGTPAAPVAPPPQPSDAAPAAE